MSNNELTLDQLTAISGDVAMGPDGSTCTDRLIWKNMKDILGGGKSIVHPEFRVAGSSDPGGLFPCGCYIAFSHKASGFPSELILFTSIS